MVAAAKVRPRITATTTKNTGIIIGPVRIIHPAIKLVGCVYQYDNRRHHYKIPIRYLDDVLVAIEVGGSKAIVEVVSALW
jgi:hypothetical protein